MKATAAAAVDGARTAWTSRRTSWHGLCQNFVRQQCWDVDGYYASAWANWLGATDKVPYNGDEFSFPLGAPVFARRAIGDPGFGHVFIAARRAASGRRIFFTSDGDRSRPGAVIPVSLDFLKAWGFVVVGHTLSINRVKLPLGGPYPKHPPLEHAVSLSKLITAAKTDGHRPQGGSTPGAEDDVRAVELALASLGLMPAEYAHDGSFGTLTCAAYARLQRNLGYTGTDANGIPGPSSTRWLGDKFGFRVTA